MWRSVLWDLGEQMLCNYCIASAPYLPNSSAWDEDVSHFLTSLFLMAAGTFLQPVQLTRCKGRCESP